MQLAHSRAFYWVATFLFVLPQTWSATQYLSEAPAMTATIVGLGYPIYFMKALGVAKLLGIAAILYGGLPTLKEWAYAGFTFDALGAFVSHASVGAPAYILAVPLALLVVQLISYFTWRRLRAGAAALPPKLAEAAGAGPRSPPPSSRVPLRGQ